MATAAGEDNGIRLGGLPPAGRTALVGRDEDVARVRVAFGATRLLTLCGPGGTGKTRLALAVLSGVPAAARTAWVDLAEIAEPRLVADTVRAALGVPSTSGTAGEAIAERVRDAEVVLGLDNCEHVAIAAAELVDQLLDDCPRLRVLATSREPLAVEGEAVWPVTPLGVPSPAAATAVAVHTSAAARLFELRAQAVVPAFRVTDDNAAAVARVCRRLDGLPLAIELAAARCRVLSAAQIAAGLDDMLRLLSSGPRTAPDRHRSLRATLDWSHALLTEPEQIVFRRLGVFAGGFDLPAAEAVTVLDAVSADTVLDVIARLVDRSLVAPRQVGDQIRYRLLAPVRGYARERLAHAGERATVAAAHLDHYADLVETAEPRLAGPRQTVELDRLEAEGNNLRAALAFAADQTPPPESGLRLAAALAPLCALRGHYREGRHWMDWAATVEADAPPTLRAKALLGSGRLAHLECDYEAAIRRLQAARTRYEEAGDRSGVAAALQLLGSVARERGRYARAEALHRESLQLAGEDGDELRVAHCHGYLGFAAWLQAHWQDATDECRRALAGSRRAGDGEGIAWALLSLGTIAQYEGELHTAADLLGQARRTAEEMTYREGLAWTSHMLGLLALRRGDPAAERLLLDALTGHRALGDRWRTAAVLDSLAWCTQTDGDDTRAVALLAAAAAIRAEIGTDVAPCERPDHDRVDATARARLDAERFARAWAYGQASILDDLLTTPPRALVGDEPSVQAAAVSASVRTDVPARTRIVTTGRLCITALGGASVHCDGRLLTPTDWGYAKPRELLFLLVASPPRSKTQIGAALWPDLDDHQLRNAFHTALRDLRRALGDSGWITFSAGRYAFDYTRDHWCDLEIFDEALTAARQARPAQAALPHLRRAIDAYRGEFAAGLSDADWVQTRRGELAHEFGRALGATGRLLAAAGRLPEAVEVYRRAVDHDPLDEAAHRHLMTALVRTGQAAQAARVYQRLAVRLDTELGIVPAPETRAVYRQLDHARS